MSDQKKEKCQGITKKGERCKNFALEDSSYCRTHYVEDEIIDTTINNLDEVCPICFENDGEKMFVLTCNHKVHLECIKEVADIRCVLCRAPMENLPEDVKNKVLENTQTYKDELEEEDRQAAEQAQELGNSMVERLFSIYIRPRPQIEMKYAMMYLRSQGVPLRYLPDKIKILVPVGHPNPPPGVLFSLLVSQTLERMREDITYNILNQNSEESDSDDSDGDDYPFQNQDNELRFMQRIIERITVNPETFAPLTFRQPPQI